MKNLTQEAIDNLIEFLESLNYTVTGPQTNKFEQGKWYYYPESMHENYLFRVVEVRIGNPVKVFYEDSFENILGETDSYFELGSPKGTESVLATPEQIEEHLLYAANQKGYAEGVKVKDISNSKELVISDFYRYYPHRDMLVYNRPDYTLDFVVVYKQGQWAEIMPEPKPQPEADKFEVGKWYYNKVRDELVRVSQVRGRLIDWDSGSLDGANVAFTQDSTYAINCVPAHADTVKEHLLNLAKEKGYFNNPHVRPFERSLSGRFGPSPFYLSGEDELYIAEDEEFMLCIYRRGEWAQITPQPKPRSVFDLVNWTSKSKPSYLSNLESGRLGQKSAIGILLDAIAEHCKQVEGDPVLDRYSIQYNPHRNDFSCEDSIPIVSPFRFPYRELAESFLSLEHSQELFRIALNVPKL